ncbi:MAG: hypothetical protein P8173_18490, partial [Gammaproteobacteria bacterium]
QRWSDTLGSQVDAYIHAKIAKSQLQDIHPTMGLTQWTEGRNAPPKETALFSENEVKAIERDEFIDFEIEDIPKAPGHLNHDPDLQARANQIAAEKKKQVPWKTITRKDVAKALAAEREMPPDTVERRIRKEWK